MNIDNRIPLILKDFVKSDISTDGVSFLSFNDWLSNEDNSNNSWTTVVRVHKKNESEDYYTFSCLIQAGERSLKKFLSNTNWFINTEFGMPKKYQIPHKGEKYDDERKGELNGVIYYPFTFRREFNNYISGYFQVIEHFLLYYNCFWVENKKEYQSIDDAGDIKTIIRIVKTQTEETILIDTHTLKDYLAVRNVHLARFHDHRRRSTMDILFLTKKIETYPLSDINSYFELDLRNDIKYKDVNSTSRLLGKEVIKAYSKPQSHEWLKKKTEKEFLKFTFQRNEQGKEVKETCNPDKLSSYFVDTGKTHFLTPVYFKRELLQKYFAEPKKYTVTEDFVSCLNIWRIEMDITNENLIQVYLGDIGRNLPYKEQLHWLQFNVPPQGKISEHRFKRDFLNEWALPDIEESPILHFKETFELIQSTFELRHGQLLFKELATNDQHLYTTLHIPSTDEWKELDDQILALAKITTDSFNNDVLVIITQKKIGDNDTKGKQIKGLTALFYEFLIKIIPNDAFRDEVIKPFNMLQALRSSSVAHRKSKELDKTLEKYNLNKLSNEHKFKHIIIELTKSLKTVVKISNNVL